MSRQDFQSNIKVRCWAKQHGLTAARAACSSIFHTDPDASFGCRTCKAGRGAPIRTRKQFMHFSANPDTSHLCRLGRPVNVATSYIIGNLLTRQNHGFVHHYFLACFFASGFLGRTFTPGCALPLGVATVAVERGNTVLQSQRII